MIPSLDTLSQICQSHLDEILDLYLKKQPALAAPLQQAMAYAACQGGKRIRPLLMYATGSALNVSHENLKPASAAIELIHAYSLIHDDLPAMDNSDLRRGKPSCHKAFNEAFAILAGDALQTLAFNILTTYPAQLHPEQRLAMVTTLSQASGLHGMAGGQALDIAGVASLDDLRQMYQLKTGALLVTSIKLAIIAGNMQDTEIDSSLETFAHNIGLAFQIQDDLLDQEALSITGKPSNLDIKNNKITYPLLLGKKKTRDIIHHLHQEALDALRCLGKNATPLHDLANFLLQRKK